MRRNTTGKTFRAFWRLLTDPQQSAELEAALETVLERAFASGLERRERRNLTGLTGTLLERGGEVHDVLYQFARGLKPFVPTFADGGLCLARLGTTYGNAGRSSVGFA